MDTTDTETTPLDGNAAAAPDPGSGDAPSSASDEAAGAPSPPESGPGPETTEDADAPKAKPESKPKTAGKAKAAPKPKRPTWAPPPADRLDGAIEALLLTAGDVLKYKRLSELLGVETQEPVLEAIQRIQAKWTETSLAVEVQEVAGGARVVTRPEYAEYVGRLKRRPQSDKLTKSLLETLSIVAYKQPVGRAEIERIRGVQAGEGLRGLLERGLARVVGRSDQPGRPMLYGTTDRFLTIFGLRDIKDLPTHGDLGRM